MYTDVNFKEWFELNEAGSTVPAGFGVPSYSAHRRAYQKYQYGIQDPLNLGRARKDDDAEFWANTQQMPTLAQKALGPFKATHAKRLDAFHYGARGSAPDSTWPFRIPKLDDLKDTENPYYGYLKGIGLPPEFMKTVSEDNPLETAVVELLKQKYKGNKKINWNGVFKIGSSKSTKDGGMVIDLWIPKFPEERRYGRDDYDYDY